MIVLWLKKISNQTLKQILTLNLEINHAARACTNQIWRFASGSMIYSVKFQCFTVITYAHYLCKKVRTIRRA